MISMALYGAILSTASGGAMVSIERAAGWSRQLRLTPLSSMAYIATKMLTSLVLGLGAVLAVYLTGIITGKPSMPAHLWIITALCVWIRSLLFAAFGLFIGYLLPSENVMQLISFAMMLFAFGGGLFVPLSQFSSALQTMATFTPLYGLNQLVHLPLVGGSMDWSWVLNVVLWLVLFVRRRTLAGSVATPRGSDLRLPFRPSSTRSRGQGLRGLSRTCWTGLAQGRGQGLSCSSGWNR